MPLLGVVFVNFKAVELQNNYKDFLERLMFLLECSENENVQDNVVLLRKARKKLSSLL